MQIGLRITLPAVMLCFLAGISVAVGRGLSGIRHFPFVERRMQDGAG